MSGGAELKGRRILVIEDSPVVAPFTAEILGELGYEVVGPAPTMAAAREMIGSEAFDGAILDVHIRGERVFPLCDELAARDVPFLLTSGYADWQIPDKWRDAPQLQKPYTIDQIEKALAEILSSSSATAQMLRASPK